MGKPVAPFSFPDLFREQQDLVVQHPEHHPAIKGLNRGKIMAFHKKTIGLYA